MTSAVKGEGNPKTDMFDKVSVIPYRVGMAVENTNHFADVKCTPNESQPPAVHSSSFLAGGSQLLVRLHVAGPRVRHDRGAGEGAGLLPQRRPHRPAPLQRLVRHRAHLLQAGAVLPRRRYVNPYIRTFFICNLF